MYSRINENKGFSLVEVIVAAALVALVSLSVLAAVSQSAVLGAKTDKIYTASIIAQKRTDLLKKFYFSDLADIAPETDTAIDINDDGVTDFVRTTAVEQQYDGYTGLLKIKVTVQRVENGQKTGGPVEIETLISDVSGA